MRAPIAAAPVMAGAAFPAAEVAELALECAELILDEADAVSKLMALLMDARSDPVAVDSLDSSDPKALLASEVMELRSLVTCERTDEATEVILEAMEEISTGLVTVVVWAAARVARAERTMAKRILNVGLIKVRLRDMLGFVRWLQR